MGLFSKRTKQENFWKWFQENESALFDFEKDQERVFDSLISQLHKISPHITFEFGPKENGYREFECGWHKGILSRSRIAPCICAFAVPLEIHQVSSSPQSFRHLVRGRFCKGGVCAY